MGYNILISDITGYKSIVIANHLKKYYRDVYIVGIDDRKLANVFHTNRIDEYIFLDSNTDYIKSINKIINNKKIDLFIPTNSREMELILLDSSLPKDILSYYGTYENFNILNDKYELSSLCKKLKIKAPLYGTRIEEMEFPFVIKPKISSSSKGVVYVKRQKDLHKVKFDSNVHVAQEYIKGVGVGYSVFAKNGKILVGSGHKRLAEFPISGGSSMYRETYNNPQMIHTAKKLLSATNWSGFAMFEFKLTNSDELYLIEVNPRIWGSINQGLKNGINYFSHIVKSEPKSFNKRKHDLKTYHSPGIYLSILKYVLKFRFHELSYFFRNCTLNKPDINVLKDPLGWLSCFLRSIL